MKTILTIIVLAAIVIGILILGVSINKDNSNTTVGWGIAKDSPLR